MKKLIAFLVLVGFLFSVTAPMAVADRRGHYRPGYGHHVRHHSHVRVYHASPDHFWLGLGFGVLTGAMASSLYYYSPPPPRVFYYEPRAVVVPPSPVVVPPARHRFGEAPEALYGQVAVTAAELNMRSQPDSESAVTGRVRKGEVLDVIESIPQWFYVRTPAGRYGWVMDRYTQPSQPVG